MRAGRRGPAHVGEGVRGGEVGGGEVVVALGHDDYDEGVRGEGLARGDAGAGVADVGAEIPLPRR